MCQIPSAGDGNELCLAQVANPLEHPHLCKVGPARLRPHRSVQVRFQQLLRKCGCFTDLTRAVPCLYSVDDKGVVTEAILDVVMSLPGGLAQQFYDVSVRCPHSVRNAQGVHTAATSASTAARDGEMEKLTRYGSEVQALSFETYGRLGHVSQHNLRSMAHHTSYCIFVLQTPAKVRGRLVRRLET